MNIISIEKATQYRVFGKEKVIVQTILGSKGCVTFVNILETAWNILIFFF